MPAKSSKTSENLENVKTAVTPRQADVRAALLQLRKKLLDLTAHNPLISFDHGRSPRYIRIADGLPDKLTELLYAGKSLSFAPVPAPDADELTQWKAGNRSTSDKRPPVAEWAVACGIDPSPDLPEQAKLKGSRRSQDQKVQTPYYPDVLEARLAGVLKLSRTAIEETGTNFLHLVFGFLEWYESDDSEKPRFAPLYTIPVNMERGTIDKVTNTYQYTLALSGEDIQFNASLATRLKDDFGYLLPTLDAETWPEEYLAMVDKAIGKKFPRWKVRRWGTIALFNFGRLLMYRDLDPANWPAGQELDKHELVTAVIAGEEKSREESLATATLYPEHAIDEIDNIHDRYPLVDVADSSQHSALVDALDGLNLVIQGPPGTGKSQTITNMIAAALYQGKTVLFVSEKMAALDVVRQRMGRLNLGQFCLELHSHTTHKVGVLDSLRERLLSRTPSPSALDDQIRYHKELEERLKKHASLINKTWKKTGMSIHEILMGAVRLRGELPLELTTFRIESISGKEWDPVWHLNLQRDLRAFHGQVESIARDIKSRNILAEHPWRGVTTPDLDQESCDHIISLLQEWRESLQTLSGHASSLFSLKNPLGDGITANEIRELAKAAETLPSTESTIFWDGLGMLRSGGMKEVETILVCIEDLNRKARDAGRLGFDEIEDFNELDNLATNLVALSECGIRMDFPINGLFDLHATCNGLIKDMLLWRGYIEDFSLAVNHQSPPFLVPQNLSLSALQELKVLTDFVDKLPASLLNQRNRIFLSPTGVAELSDFNIRCRDLNNRNKELSQKFDLSAARVLTDLGPIISQLPPLPLIKRLLNSDYRSAKSKVFKILLQPKQDWNHQTIQVQLKTLEEYLKHEQSFVNDSGWKQLLGDAFQGLETDTSLIETLATWHLQVSAHFYVTEGSIFRERRLTDAGSWLMDASSEVLSKLSIFQTAGLKHVVSSLEVQLPKLASATVNRENIHLAMPLVDEDSWAQSIKTIQRVVPNLEKLLLIIPFGRTVTLEDAKSSLLLYSQIRDDWRRERLSYEELNEKHFDGELPNSPFPTKSVKDKLQATRAWCYWLNDEATLRILKEMIEISPTTAEAERIRAWGILSHGHLVHTESRREWFYAASKLEAETWASGSGLADLVLRADEALSSADLLKAFTVFLRTRSHLQNSGLARFTDEIEKRHLPVDAYTAAYEHAVLASLADEVLRQEPALRRFDGLNQTEIQRDYATCDQNVLNLMRARIAAQISKKKVPQGYRGTRVGQHTEFELLSNELAKQTRHIPIRQLLNRAGDAIQSLKPCFMMGPRSVAQYLAPDGLRFDLLIIDEASQMRPADALGAVARCGQLVVVGDSKQLAPSSFFDRIDGTVESEEEQYQTTVADSILDAVAPIFRSRSLRWHYRSRHESLIAFSNLRFYGNNLMIFPSPHSEDTGLGIQYHYVSDGIFENQINRAEAEMIVARLETLLTSDASLSLGVATMNAKQRDLIDRMIEDRAKLNSAFGDALADNIRLREPLFVKNLENVQGDEREVILISCTYGKDGQGNFFQRFGPINSSDGWRRLNVLFTRSRTRMEIFSSMQYTQIRDDPTSSEGVRALRGFLHYAETKNLNIQRPSGREPDSDFEVAVAQMFANHGFETDCQIGVAGFFIDLAGRIQVASAIRKVGNGPGAV